MSSCIDQMLGHKVSLKFIKMESHEVIFSDQNGIKLETNKRTFEKFTNMWKSNNTLLNKQWVKELKMEIRMYLKINEY